MKRFLAWSILAIASSVMFYIVLLLAYQTTGSWTGAVIEVSMLAGIVWALGWAVMEDWKA